MIHIIRQLRPFWKTVLVIIALLFLQAYCDLALPSYTSDIIDTGIQNSGIEHTVPQAVTADEYRLAGLFMTDSEKAEWESAYEKDTVYTLTGEAEADWDRLDADLSVPLLLNYRMSRVTLTQWQGFVSSSGNGAASPMTPEQAGQAFGITVSSFSEATGETNADGSAASETYYDIRPLMAAMQKAGLFTAGALTAVRANAESGFSALGEQLISSMGIAYAVQCDRAAGIDVGAVQTAYLWHTGTMMILLSLLQTAAAVAAGFFAARVGAGAGRNMRDAVFAGVMGFSNTEINHFETASLITRSTNDVQQIQMVITLLLRMVAYAPILGIGGLIRVVNTHAGMGWVIGLAILLILGLIAFLMAVAMPKFKLMQKMVDRLNLVSREILTGLSVIRAFNREEQEEKRFDDANRDLTKTMLFTSRVMTFMMPLMMLIMNGLTVLIVWVAAHRIDSGVLQVGSMTAFITYAMMIVMSFLMLTAMSIILPRATVAADRIDEVIRTRSSITDPEHPLSPAKTEGRLRFDHVSFRYPGAESDALSDISFTAEPGQTTAIIGSTGCGKSTLVDLIPRLYDVTGGHISLDGQDIRALTLADLRDRIGFVPQKGVLFSGTVASNLRFGRSGATDAQIAEAARIAQADGFIGEMPEKYESPIAQGGSNVSGGQKQRLAIARALVKDPQILVFDDSFSALDLKTDAALRRELAPRIKDRTVIIVAQRISTILHAEKILVLEEGKLAGSGTHDELMKNCETYRQIALSQLTAGELGLEGGEGA